MSDGFTVHASRKVETIAADARSVGLKAHIFSMSARMAFGVRENAQKLQPWEIAFNDRAKRCAQTNGAGNEPAT